MQLNLPRRQTNEERIAIMMSVKDGKLTMEQALAKIGGSGTESETPVAAKNVDTAKSDPTADPAAAAAAVVCGVVWCGVVWCGVVWCGILPLWYFVLYHVRSNGHVSKQISATNFRPLHRKSPCRWRGRPARRQLSGVKRRQLPPLLKKTAPRRAVHQPSPHQQSLHQQ
jgi:hypothetical protein